jgi:hypothetical protein
MQTLRGDKEWKDSLPENIAFRVIAMHRDCDEFTPWMQGFTPKEHVEMQQEQARLHWQERREEADRRWREEQADQAHRWRQDDQRSEARWRWFELLVMAVIVTGVSGFAQIAAALIERGSWFPDKPTETKAVQPPAKPPA